MCTFFFCARRFCFFRAFFSSRFGALILLHACKHESVKKRQPPPLVITEPDHNGISQESTEKLPPHVVMTSQAYIQIQDNCHEKVINLHYFLQDPCSYGQ
jgi:hypothetical protein